jgi:photosystem II stability/assembly factor-like uncharacterized protein
VEPIEEPALSRRARRAVALIAASLTVIVVASILYLHPKIEGPAPKVAPPAPTPSPKLLGTQYWADFAFVTPTLGWSLVESQVSPQYWIFRTTDGAKSWEQQLYGENVDPSNNYRFYERRMSFQFFNRIQGFAFIRSHDVYRTSDGGRQWTKMNLPPYSLESLSFSDLLHGWILGWEEGSSPGYPIFHLEATADGGSTWTALPSPKVAKTTYGFVFGGVMFRSPREGWARGNDVDQPAVYSSNDGGVTWQQQLLPLPLTSGPPTGKGTYPRSDVRLIPGGGLLAMAHDAAFTSFDGAATWRQIAPPPGTSYYRNIAFQDATHWWVMQYDSSLFKTSDAGQTWKRVSFQLDTLIYEIGVVDARNAWARINSQDPKWRGYGLALTKDGGVHWTYASAPMLP